MGVTPIELGPFTEGVNLVDPLTKLSPNELSVCRNFRTGVRGDFYKRPGCGGYGSSPAKVNGDVFVNLLSRYYKSDGTKMLLATADGYLYRGTDATGVWSKINVGGTAGNKMHVTNLIDWMVYKNRIYFADGYKCVRYNGDTPPNGSRYCGYYAHITTGWTLTPGTGGSMTVGTYLYAMSNVSGDLGEGPICTGKSVTVTGLNTKVTLTGLDSASSAWETTAKKLYRTKVGGTLYYLVATLAWDATTYDDLTADTALGDEYIPVSAPPATARYVIMGHDDRAYWFGMTATGDQSLVKVSDVGFPDRVLDSEFFTVSNNDGDIITGGGLVPGGIVFFKKTSMWLSRAFGYPLINIYPKEKRGSGVGTTSPFSVVTTPIGLIFLSQRGEIYKFDGTNIEEIGRKVASEFKGMTQSARGLVVACYHDYRYIISYDYRGSKGYNWKTLEYDTITGKWEGPHENDPYYTPSYYSVWDSVLDNSELYWGESRAVTGSYVYGRTEFTEYDRGYKFLSVAATGAVPRANLGEVKTTKAFVHGEISGDANLIFTHIDEMGVRTSVNMNVAVYSIGSILNGPDLLGATVGCFTLGGSAITQVMEGPLGPGARSRVPIYEIMDSGTASRAKMNVIQILAEGLPLK